MVFYFTGSYWVETKLVVKSPSYDKGRNDAIKDKCWPFDAGVLNSIGDISVNSSNLRYISPCIHSMYLFEKKLFYELAKFRFLTINSSLHLFSSSRLIRFSCFLKYFLFAACRLNQVYANVLTWGRRASMNG